MTRSKPMLMTQKFGNKLWWNTFGLDDREGQFHLKYGVEKSTLN